MAVSNFFKFVFVLILQNAQISGEHLHDHWSSGYFTAIMIDDNACIRSI